MKTASRSLQLAGGIAAIWFVSTLTSMGITNSIPHSWSFEGMTNGQDIVNIGTDSWYGDPEAFVATNAIYSTPTVGYPITNETHTTYAHLSAPVTNAITSGTTLVWIDHMVKPEMWKQDDPPADIPSDTHMAYYLNTNGHIVVYSLIIDEGGAIDTNQVPNPTWTELNNTPITSGDWARVSVGLQYDISKTDWTRPYYQVKVNGALQTSQNAIIDPANYNFTNNGTYFALAIESAANLNSIVMKGNGDFDDFVVTTNTPVFTFKYVIVASVVAGDEGGNINPEGSIEVNPGADQTFVVTASNYWTIDKVIVVENGATSTNIPTSSPYTNTFLSVTNNGSIDVYFAAARTNGVPLWWMHEAGLDGSDPDDDPDGDGFSTSDEYVSSTDPDNSNSFLRITRTWQENGTNYVQWESAYIDSTLPPFNVLSSTNLNSGVFNPAGTQVRGMTNIWSQPVATPGMFYRVSAPATP